MKIPSQSAFVKCLTGLSLAAGISACNLYSPIDTPTSDKQLLSAARACLDRADYGCALSNYQKISSSQADIVNSELAFTILAQNGAGFGTFASTLGSGATGLGLTKLAEALASGAGLAKRKAIYVAYQKVTLIQDSGVQSLTRFLTAASLAAEIMAEGAGGDGILRKINLAAAGCNKANCASGGCAAPSPDNIPAGTGPSITTTAGAAPPTLDLLSSAISEALTGLQNLSPGGSFSSTSSLFTAITQGGPPGIIGAPCFRGTLLDQGIGE